MWKLIFLLSICALTAMAAVIRPAPDFGWPAAGKVTSLRAAKGQPVVLLIADSPRNGAFRKQAKRLRESYQQFASRKVLFVAAFRDGAGGELRSDIPFVIANNGASVAAAYGAGSDFKLVVIGVDGNVDMETESVQPASRVRDVIRNSYESQNAGRKQ